jgi:dihydrodipicolinate synthase/N-acetylneuraminate lyase
MAEMDLRGVIVPVVTPVDRDENTDVPALRKLISFLIDSGVHGIFVSGSAGEGPLLDFGQWVKMAEAAFDEVGGRVPLLGGTMDTSTHKVVERVHTLRKIGFRAMVVVPTYYITVKTHDEHMRLFGAAKEACGDAEMVAYNIPSCTGSVVAVDTMCEMAKRGWIRYCKESSGDMAYFTDLSTGSRDVGLRILMGDEVIMADALKMGAVGAVPVCANFEPRTFIDAYSAAAAKDYVELQRMQERVLYLRKHILQSGVSWLAGVKWAISTLGIGTGLPLSPIEPAGQNQRKMIAQIERRA